MACEFGYLSTLMAFPHSIWLVAPLTVATAGFADEALQARFHDRIVPLLERYCVDCHDAETLKGDLDLSRFDSVAGVQEEFALWQTVAQQLVEEEMPPKDPQPTAEERADMVAWTHEVIEAIDWTIRGEVGRLTLPRLTKQEYNRTLRDLLGIDFKPGDLLLDDGQGLSGFTNDRDALFISPTLAEQLFAAPEYALGAVLALREPPMTQRFEAEDMLMTERGSQPLELPGGGVGHSLAGAGQRTLFDEMSVPADGWYRITVRAVGIGGDSGMRLRIDNEVRADFAVAAEPMEQSVELLLRGGTHQMVWNIELSPELRRVEEERKEVKRVAAAKSRANQKSKGKAVPFPENAADLVAAASSKNSPKFPTAGETATAEPRRVLALNRALEGMQRRLEYLRLVTPQGDPDLLRTYYNLLPERTADMAKFKEELATSLGLSVAEIDRILVEANREKFTDNETILRESMEVIGVRYQAGFLLGRGAAQTPREVGAPGVDWIVVEGPIVPAGADPSRVAALFPKEAEPIKVTLADFLTRSFRRPLREGELDRHRALYDRERGEGESHEAALKLTYTAALVSPSFLYRDEVGEGGAAFVLNDHQLASRLSYFLWMTMPDDSLRSLADAGQLRDETVLREQVRRMLADPRARAFTESFLGQWLGFAGLGTEHVPDAKRFPGFHPGLAAAMKMEPVLVFERLLREGRSLTELLDGRETFANAELAALYGLPGITGADFQPVQWEDANRGGLLGMAAVLTASSTPNRTSPVLRGKWVLENLLGRHLAEPPADAGQLSDKAGEERGKTLREELAAHRRNESCAGCHDKIDPIGFGLENFDAVGRFRELEAGRPVDAAGALPGGVSFTGPEEMRRILSERHREEFLEQVTRKLAAYALGRALRVQDEGAVRGWLEELKVADDRADALVEAIVVSEAFRQQGGGG